MWELTQKIHEVLDTGMRSTQFTPANNMTQTPSKVVNFYFLGLFKVNGHGELWNA